MKKVVIKNTSKLKFKGLKNNCHNPCVCQWKLRNLLGQCNEFRICAKTFLVPESKQTSKCQNEDASYSKLLWSVALIWFTVLCLDKALFPACWHNVTNRLFNVIFYLFFVARLSRKSNKFILNFHLKVWNVSKREILKWDLLFFEYIKLMKGIF